MFQEERRGKTDSSMCLKNKRTESTGTFRAACTILGECDIEWITGSQDPLELSSRVVPSLKRQENLAAMAHLTLSTTHSGAPLPEHNNDQKPARTRIEPNVPIQHSKPMYLLLLL